MLQHPYSSVTVAPGFTLFHFHPGEQGGAKLMADYLDRFRVSDEQIKSNEREEVKALEELKKELFGFHKRSDPSSGSSGLSGLDRFKVKDVQIQAKREEQDKRSVEPSGLKEISQLQRHPDQPNTPPYHRPQHSLGKEADNRSTKTASQGRLPSPPATLPSSPLQQPSDSIVRKAVGSDSLQESGTDGEFPAMRVYDNEKGDVQVFKIFVEKCKTDKELVKQRLLKMSKSQGPIVNEPPKERTSDAAANEVKASLHGINEEKELAIKEDVVSKEQLRLRLEEREQEERKGWQETEDDCSGEAFSTVVVNEEVVANIRDLLAKEKEKDSFVDKHPQKKKAGESEREERRDRDREKERHKKKEGRRDRDKDREKKKEKDNKKDKGEKDKERDKRRRRSAEEERERGKLSEEERERDRRRKSAEEDRERNERGLERPKESPKIEANRRKIDPSAEDPHKSEVGVKDTRKENNKLDVMQLLQEEENFLWNNLANFTEER